jgi:hypothetical protein
VKQQHVVSLVVGFTAGLAGLLASASPAAASFPMLKLRSGSSFQCLQPVGGSIEPGAAIVQEPCNSDPAQLWRQDPVGDNLFHYVNAASGLCLDARGGANNGTPVQQWTCNHISNENWQLPSSFPGEYPPLISRVSGTSSHCLDLPGEQTDPGHAMQIARCNGALGQQWEVLLG